MAPLGRARSAAAVALAALGLVGCRKAAGEPVAPERASAAARATAPAARWVFHPKGAQVTSARLQLPGAELVVDQGGSRWLVTGDAAPEPAPYGAPEALIAVRQRGERFAFVGESGAVYGSEQPLGPFVSTHAPPTPSFGAAVFEEVILAVGRDGQLRRSVDLGESWERVEVDAFAAAVALDEQGRSLLLSVPEQWFWSTDRGASFVKVTPGTVAPREVEGGGSRIFVRGALGQYAFEGGAFVAVGAAPPSRPATWTLPRGPMASDVRLGHAVIERDFVAIVQERGGHALLRGSLGGGLKTRRTAGLDDCARHRMARVGARLAVLCTKKGQGRASTQLWLYRGDVDTARFQPESVLLWGDFERARLALAKDGTVALSGVCVQGERDGGCTPRGTHLLSPGATELLAAPTALEDLPQALAFAGAGQLVMATVRDKDGRAVLVVRTKADEGLGRTIDLSAALDLAERATAVDLLPALSPALVGVVVHQGDEQTVATIDANGRLVTSGRVPHGATTVHGAGLRLAALSVAQRTLYESTDGGVTWSKVSVPRALCPAERTDCTPHLACGDAGCLLGDELARVGWGAEATPLLAAPPTGGRPTQVRAQAADYHCRFDAERPLDLPHLVEPPGATDSALGDADFAGIEFDRATAAIDFVWVRRGERRARRAAGLGAVNQPEHYALAVVPQVEGAAALRYRVPARQTGDRMLSEIEVAWNNRITQTAARQRFPQLIESKQGDYHTGSSGPGDAFPALLSVAGTGVYLAIHRTGSGEQATYFFKPDGYETLAAPRLPGAADVPEAEYMRIGDEHVPLGFADDRSQVFLGSTRALPEGGAALLLGEAPLSLGRAQGMRLSYLGDRIGTLSMMADVEGSYWSAHFAELAGPSGQVLGPVVRAPLKPDLAPLPHACSETVLRTTPRIVAPAFPGQTPLLRVQRGAAEVGTFQLGGAVLHGTPEDACVAAWAGEPAAGSVGAGAAVLLLPTAGGFVGWFFSAKGEARQPAGYEAWPLACAPAG